MTEVNEPNITTAHPPLLELAKQHLEHGQVSLDSWSTGDAGFSDFMEALHFQESEFGRNDHPSMALTYYWIGRALHKQKFYEHSVDHYRKALRIQELSYGHYNHFVGETYLSLGSVYADEGSFANALVAYGAARRIEQRIYGHQCGPWQIETSKIRPILTKLGRTDDEIQGKFSHMEKSLLHEIEGDIFLKKSDVSSALWQYDEAARVEELKFGIYNANLALVRRKIAWTSLSPEKDLAPPLGIKSCPLEGACESFRDGDRLYLDGDYEQAVSSYEKAALVGQDNSVGPNMTPTLCLHILYFFLYYGLFVGCKKLLSHNRTFFPSTLLVEDNHKEKESKPESSIEDDKKDKTTEQDLEEVTNDNLVESGSRILGEAMAARELHQGTIAFLNDNPGHDENHMEHEDTAIILLPDSAEWSIHPTDSIALEYPQRIMDS